MEKLYKNRLWLIEHYTTREESMRAMARKARCDDGTICYWLRKMGIPIRTPLYYGIDSLWRNRGWLYEHYITREESTPVMAKEAGCGYKSINKWLHRYGIPVRNPAEGQFLAVKNSVIITPDLLKFLRGEITGDGCVRMASNRSACYKHSSKYKKYLIWLSGRLDAWGIEQSGRITDWEDKETGAIVYHYVSRSYPELVPIYKRWYPNGKKIVPQDLKLTPLMARQWYLGDGHLEARKHPRPGIVLSTNDFDWPSIKHLLEELDRLGFKATHQPSCNKIRIWVCSVLDFLEWIGPCPISCYDYKWKIQPFL